VDAAFTAARMTYLAATGDDGASVSWPSVSTNVVAVGGTTLSYTGSGARSEVAWSGTGGGTSAYTATPAYQKNTVPGLGTVPRRTVADVAFNANPSSGQYTAVMKPGSTAVNWLSVGGTSLATPQWAGLVAIANALRAQAAKAPLGAPHALLYGPIASTPGTYASAFADITRGSHGSCTSCTARIGYDPLTGLGTPNGSQVLAALAGASVAPAAPAAPVDTATKVTTTSGPTITAAAITGVAGKPLTGKITVTAPGASSVQVSVAGVPAGMGFTMSGLTLTASWPSPKTGSYTLKVTAVDNAGRSASASVPVTISAK
jgi:subtilase family serine protease